MSTDSTSLELDPRYDASRVTGALNLPIAPAASPVKREAT
jgi:hypothetical protein